MRAQGLLVSSVASGSTLATLFFAAPSRRLPTTSVSSPICLMRSSGVPRWQNTEVRRHVRRSCVPRSGGAAAMDPPRRHTFLPLSSSSSTRHPHCCQQRRQLSSSAAWATLGLDSTRADLYNQSEIKAAYHQKAREVHPDMIAQKGDCTEEDIRKQTAKFQQLAAAVTDVLSDKMAAGALGNTKVDDTNGRDASKDVFARSIFEMIHAEIDDTVRAETREAGAMSQGGPDKGGWWVLAQMAASEGASPMPDGPRSFVPATRREAVGGRKRTWKRTRGRRR